MTIPPPRIEPRPTTFDDLRSVIDQYVESVVSAEGTDSGLLVALAEYGRRWEVVGETVVPLGAPSTVELFERRPLALRRCGTTQRVALGDARSGHAQFYVPDHAIRMSRKIEVTDVFRQSVGVPPLEGVRDTPESRALYSADPDRPYFIDVAIKLRPSIDLLVVHGALAALVAVACVVALLYEDKDVRPVLSLLVVPTTFAVAVLLSREQTSLATRVLRPVRVGLLALAGVLWAIVLVRVV